MDLLLQRGDHVRGHSGAPIIIEGEQELVQRAMLRLTLRRGALPQEPLLGSRLHCLKVQGNRAALNTQALAAVREALAPIGGLYTREVECAYDTCTQRLCVRVLLAIQEQNYRLEVVV